VAPLASEWIAFLAQKKNVVTGYAREAFARHDV
jgi:hypothetical protein